MKPEIDSILPGTAAQLARYGKQRLRAIARLAAHEAVDRQALADKRAADALAAVEEGRFGSTPERTAVRDLADELDDRYWALEPTTDADAHEPISDARLDAFRRARAASAIWAALDEDPLLAAFDALYETWAALGSDDESIRALVGGPGGRENP